MPTLRYVSLNNRVLHHNSWIRSTAIKQILFGGAKNLPDSLEKACLRAQEVGTDCKKCLP